MTIDEACTSSPLAVDRRASTTLCSLKLADTSGCTLSLPGNARREQQQQALLHNIKGSWQRVFRHCYSQEHGVSFDGVASRWQSHTTREEGHRPDGGQSQAGHCALVRSALLHMHYSSLKQHIQRSTFNGLINVRLKKRRK